MFSLLWQHVKCAAKYIDNELYVVKGENPESYEIIEHQSIKQVLADPLTKSLPPKSTWVLWEAYDFWIIKGPKERLRSLFQYRKVHCGC